MKITIIGCGWLGLPLLESLVAAKHTVWGTGRREENLVAITAAGGKAFRVDLPKNFFGAVFGGQDLVVITLPPGGRRLGPKATTAYLETLAPLAPLFKGKNEAHVLYTSSTGVYGAAAGAVDEQGAMMPDTHSGRAVVAAEAWLREQTDRLTVLRLAGLIGPDRHPGTFYGGKDRAIPMADAPINLVHRDDVITAVHTLIAAGLPAGTFNVCAAAHPAKGDYYTAMSNQLGLTIAGTETGGAEGKVVVSDRLRGLGWKPGCDDLAI